MHLARVRKPSRKRTAPSGQLPGQRLPRQLQPIQLLQKTPSQKNFSGSEHKVAPMTESLSTHSRFKVCVSILFICYNNIFRAPYLFLWPWLATPHLLSASLTCVTNWTTTFRWWEDKPPNSRNSDGI